jgi:predicted O-linked N-acetylglucosamine transferase (SPINDLY family)
MDSLSSIASAGISEVRKARDAPLTRITTAKSAASVNNAASHTTKNAIDSCHDQSHGFKKQSLAEGQAQLRRFPTGYLYCELHRPLDRYFDNFRVLPFSTDFSTMHSSIHIERF